MSELSPCWTIFGTVCEINLEERSECLERRTMGKMVLLICWLPGDCLSPFEGECPLSCVGYVIKALTCSSCETLHQSNPAKAMQCFDLGLLGELHGSNPQNKVQVASYHILPQR